MNDDMSHSVGIASVIDDTHDDASTLLGNTVPLGEFLDAQIAKAKELETSENYESPITPSTPIRDKIPDVPEADEEFAREFMAFDTNKGIEGLIAMVKERAMNKMMKLDPRFATSPIFVTDKDYEFSVDPELITLVESDPFHGYESEKVVAHLTKLNDIATLFAQEEKIRYYYILKLFPFSLKGDAKVWFNNLAPGCVRSPQDMIYYFTEKYFPAHMRQAALQEIYNFKQLEEECLPQAWGRLLQLLNALPDHPLKKNEILDIFYNGLTDASRDYLDSCAGCVFRERTVEQAQELLNNLLKNADDWTLPEPPPKPTPKKRGILFLSPEDMQEAKKSMKEKGIKSEDVKNLPPIEEIHGLILRNR